MLLRRSLHWIILTTLLFGVVIALAQESLPPLPTDTTDWVLLPNSLAFGQIDTVSPEQSYLLLVHKGDNLELTMRRTGGSIIPVMRLLTLDGDTLMEAEPGDLAGRTTTLSYPAERDMWLRVIATQPDNDSNDGTYTLSLDGTTPALYELVAAGVPSSDSPTLLQSGTLAGRLQTDSLTYQIPLNSDETLHLSAGGTKIPALTLADTDGKDVSKSDSSGMLSYRANETSWYLLTIKPSEAGDFTLEIGVDHPKEVAMAGGALSDLMTLTPSPTPTPSATFTPTFTPTNTPTATFTFTPTFTPTDTLTPSSTFTPSKTPTPSNTPTASLTFTPSSTFTPSKTPTRTLTPRPTATPTRTPTHLPTATSQQVCGGKSTPFTVGQEVIVDFNSNGALRILNNFEGSARQTLVQAYDGHILELIDGPECSGGVWYWWVYFPRQDIYGWAAEGDDRPFLCSLNSPECR